MALLLCHILNGGFKLYSPSLKKLWTHFLTRVTMAAIFVFVPALHTKLHLIPPEYYAHFIVGVRLGYIIMSLETILFIHHLNLERMDGGNHHLNDSIKDDNNNKMEGGDKDTQADDRKITGNDHLTVAFLKISNSMILLNYPYVRYIQLSSRIPTIYNMIQHVVSTSLQHEIRRHDD